MKIPLSRRIAFTLAAPLAATVVAIAITSVVLVLAGSDPVETFRLMFDNGRKLETFVDTLNRGTPLYISAVAAAIGFRMNLFNIGVEGQYILAAFAAAVIGAKVTLPGPLHVLTIVMTAMIVGTAFSGFAGLLKVTRGVNEVISTIMLNSIVLAGFIPALLPRFIDDPTASNQGTSKVAESGWMPDLNWLLELVTRDIKAGETLADSLEKAGVLTTTGYNLIRSGEKSGKLPQMMKSVARLYDEGARNRMQRVIAIIGVLIGSIILGVILAITTVNDVKF